MITVIYILFGVTIWVLVPNDLKYRLLRYHAQNLAKEDKRGLLNWRCWWHLGPIGFRVHVCTGSSVGAYMNINNDEHEICFHASLGFLALWFSVHSRSLHDFLFPKKGQREIGFRFHSGSLWIQPWTDPWNGKVVVFHIWDTLAGNPEYTDQDLFLTPAKLALPEATYDIEVKMFRSTWSRNRWFREEITRAEIKVVDKKGIPIPGKGENSWDCGDTSTHSLTTPAKTVGEAIGSLYDSIAETRERHGGGIAMYNERKKYKNG